MDFKTEVNTDIASREGAVSEIPSRVSTPISLVRADDWIDTHVGLCSLRHVVNVHRQRQVTIQSVSERHRYIAKYARLFLCFER